MNRIILFILCLSIIVPYACVDSEKETSLSTSDLEGRWTVTEAIRDNKSTNTMDSGVFEFGINQQFTTNIPGYQNLGTYTLEDKTISFSNENFNDLEIIEVDTSKRLITVSTEISDFRFSFKLKKL